MRLIDADELPYSNIKTNEYGYVEVIKSVVLEEDIAKAQTVQAIPLKKVKEARGEIDRHSLKFSSPKWADTTLVDIKDVYRILDKLIEESEE